MKKLVLFLICLGFILVSCQQPNVEKEEPEVQVKTTKSAPKQEEPVEVEVPVVYETPEVSCTCLFAWQMGYVEDFYTEMVELCYQLSISVKNAEYFSWKLPEEFLSGKYYYYVEPDSKAYEEYTSETTFEEHDGYYTWKAYVYINQLDYFPFLYYYSEGDFSKNCVQAVKNSFVLK